MLFITYQCEHVINIKYIKLDYILNLYYLYTCTKSIINEEMSVELHENEMVEVLGFTVRKTKERAFRVRFRNNEIRATVFNGRPEVSMSANEKKVCIELWRPENPKRSTKSCQTLKDGLIRKINKKIPTEYWSVESIYYGNSRYADSLTLNLRIAEVAQEYTIATKRFF